jgi:hypothetical protein
MYVFLNTKQKFFYLLLLCKAFFSCFAAACIFVLIQLATAVFLHLALQNKPVSFFGCVAYRTTLTVAYLLLYFNRTCCFTLPPNLV